jgi:hydroxymethylglutaryl-CoA synthase
MITKGLNIQMKSVPGPDEDVITISVEAARNLMKRCAVNPKDIGAIYAGSESHPYAVKPTASVVAEAIDATPNLTSADYEFACKAGTAAIQTCMGLVGAGYIKYGLAIGADISQGAPGDPLEYSASAGGAAFLIGAQEGDHKPIALINHTASYTTDTPDFWRREGARYPSHGERFTGGPAYFRHIINCASRLFSLAGTKPEDYKYAVFHQPNGKFPATVGKRLGFTPEQIKTGLLCPRIGNTYSGATLIGLAAILDVAQPGDRIFAVSYGSGAGADGFDLQVTDEITLCNRNPTDTVEAMISNYTLLDYALYAKYREKIVL